jgi:hypothetical protein
LEAMNFSPYESHRKFQFSGQCFFLAMDPLTAGFPYPLLWFSSILETVLFETEKFYLPSSLEIMKDENF